MSRSTSTHIYDLMRQHGYDCLTPSTTKRANHIRKMLENDGELPDWLLGKVSVEESTTVVCKFLE